MIENPRSLVDVPEGSADTMMADIEGGQWDEAQATRCLTLLEEADELLICLGQGALGAHLSLVIERLKERLPPLSDLSRR